MAEHSKLPWRTSEIGLRMMIRANDLTIVALRHRLDRRTHEENFEYIVKACNAFPDLVKALEESALQLEYMNERMPTGTSTAVLARIHHLLSRVKGAPDHG